MKLYVIIDIETYSRTRLTDSGKREGRGLANYSADKFAEVLCCCIAVLDSNGRLIEQRSFEGNPHESYIQELAKKSASLTFVAHNAEFESVFLEPFLTGALGRPPKWYCTASHAAWLGLPRALDRAAPALNCEYLKSDTGKQLIAYSVKAAMNGIGADVLRQDRDFMDRLIEYCAADVKATVSLFLALNGIAPFPSFEQNIWAFTKRLNRRGVPIDTASVRSIRNVLFLYRLRLCALTRQLTDGKCERPTQTKYLHELLKQSAQEIDNFSYDTMRAALDEGRVTGRAAKLMELKCAAVHSAHRKYDALSRLMSADGRLHDGYKYYGASKTGRWTSAGVQLQNLPRLLKKPDGTSYGLPDFEHDCEDFDPHLLKKAGALVRPMIKAPTGKRLFVADYSNIEPRLAFWLTGCRQGLKDLEGDIYLAMASQIYGETISDKKDKRRTVGKEAILGLGYQMGALTYLRCLRAAGVFSREDDEDECLQFCQGVVDAYRLRYIEIKKCWSSLQACAVYCVRTGEPVTQPRFCMRMNGNFLVLESPSGVPRYYWRPQINRKTFTWNGEEREADTVSYMDSNGVMTPMYGGKWFENLIQGLARDVLCEAMLRAERAGFDIIMTTHDEVCVEARAGQRLEDLMEVLTRAPAWLVNEDGTPFTVPAEGSECIRYTK